MDKQQLLDILTPWEQQHLLAHWEQLDSVAQLALSEQIHSVDFEQLKHLFFDPHGSVDWQAVAGRAVAPPSFRLNVPRDRFSREEAIEAGQTVLAEGRVGAILVAGGQGTRLGFSHPKGMFPIGPVSERTLFEMHADQLRAIAKKYGRSVPLYLMTSPATDSETKQFFTEHKDCELPFGNLQIFCQGTMPAVERASGRILLEAPGKLALSPDGHGGTLDALSASGCLQDAQARGIEHLYYFQVDNPLAQICEAELIGYHVLTESEISTQVIAKQDPADKVGNVVSVDDKVTIIEYSDLPTDAGERRNRKGGLELWAGNIAIHVFDVEFLARSVENPDALPFHRAIKKVPHIDGRGEYVAPETENAVKFERFIFDLLSQTEKSIVVEVDPATTFAPVKNSNLSDKDTPDTSKQAISQLHRGWLEAAGIVVDEGVAVEINPLFATTVEEIQDKLEAGICITEPTYFS